MYNPETIKFVVVDGGDIRDATDGERTQFFHGDPFQDWGYVDEFTDHAGEIVGYVVGKPL